MVSCSICMLLVYSTFFKVAQMQGTQYCSIPWKPYVPSQSPRSYNPPLILREKKSSSGYDIVLPEVFNNGKVIRVPIDSDLVISCPGGLLNSFSNLDVIEAECDNQGQLFIKLLSQPQTTMNLMGCSQKILEKTQEYVKNIQEYDKCGNNPRQPDGDLIKLGFDSNAGFFYPQIEVCFDKALNRTIWSRHTLHGHNIAASSRDRTSTWKTDALYGDPKLGKIIHWNTIYKGKNQATLFKQLLNKDVIFPSGTKPPKGSGLPEGLFLAKGHLSPNADFVTTAERESTFHYINAVPQWQSNNNNNWARIVEVSVKNLAKKTRSELTVITGGHRALRLRNVVTGQIVPISLGPSGQVPVPKFIWKVVTNKAKTAGVGFVLINNPYVDLLPRNDPMNVSPDPPEDLCRDVCDKLDSWFNGNTNARTDYTKGYTYCCRVDELRQHISTMPAEYKNIHILLGEK